MILIPSERSLTVRCPAKINLFLETHGLRPDGYHEIETVMQAVTLYDDIVLAPRTLRARTSCARTEPGIEFRCSDPALPSGRGNLACLAAERILEKAALSGGVSLTLEKRIPYGSGLGGGSSDAAGVLAGLNQLLQLDLPSESLTELAAGIGSDVAFFLHGGTALCTGRGENVTPIATPMVGHYIIWHPGVILSTAEVYKNLPRWGLTTGNRSATVLTSSLVSGDSERVAAGLFNRLDGVAVAMSSEVARAKQMLTRVAGRPALVSGSGSAVYVMVDSAEWARAVADELRTRSVGQVFVAQTERPASS